ncbi:hypothetical protein LCGC14_1636660 [marine sediment metagenome]|uniref:Uncharacterized protein n=1 Tax=marine sediment metagenome TaxID=412755 RepID=A0A0F9IN99_9ZZZZ
MKCYCNHPICLRCLFSDIFVMIIDCICEWGATILVLFVLAAIFGSICYTAGVESQKVWF